MCLRISNGSSSWLCVEDGPGAKDRYDQCGLSVTPTRMGIFNPCQSSTGGFTSSSPPSMAYDNANPYRLLATLDGQHDDTIACMQFSLCGEYLVTGADDLRMNVFDCGNNFKNILSISSTSPASAICWDPNKPRSCFVGYSSGAVVSHTFGNDQEEWAAEILLFNGRCRIVALAWDSVLAIATERNVFLVNDVKASE